MSEVKEHSVIYLSPSDDPEREWCQDDVWEESVRYNLGADFDRVTAERDAALAELAQANKKIDKAWNRTSALDHKGFIPGALDAWKRPVPQHLPYDFSGNPGASATQYCNGWNDCGGYWSAHASELQQREKALQALLTAADERADVLEGLLRLARGAIGENQWTLLTKDIDAMLSQDAKRTNNSGKAHCPHDGICHTSEETCAEARARIASLTAPAGAGQ